MIAAISLTLITSSLVDRMNKERDNNGIITGGAHTDKTPLLSISSLPIEIWYEGPDYVVADKPPGMAVYPQDAQGRDSLVNALFQSNRWLAEMETSHRPGVIHELGVSDRGLVLVAKTDEAAQRLRQHYQNHQLTFSYRVRMPASLSGRKEAPVTVFDRRTYPDGRAILDIDSPLGDTSRLREIWLDSPKEPLFFVLYAIEIKDNNTRFQVALGERRNLPLIDLYTVPPCSVCNGTKNFLASNGFWYSDHDLSDSANIEPMRQLRGSQRGIPVIHINDHVLVGFQRQQLKSLLNLY